MKPGRVETKVSVSQIQRNDDNSMIKIKTEVYVSGAERFVAIANWEVCHSGEEPRNHFREIKRFDLSMCRHPNLTSIVPKGTGKVPTSLLEMPFLARYLILANEETLLKHPSMNHGIYLRLTKFAQESSSRLRSGRDPIDERLVAVEKDLRDLLEGRGNFSHGVLESCVDGVTWSTQYGRNTLGLLQKVEEILPNGWKLEPNWPCPVKLQIMTDFVNSMMKGLEVLGGDNTSISRREQAAALSDVELKAYNFYEAFP